MRNLKFLLVIIITASMLNAMSKRIVISNGDNLKYERSENLNTIYKEKSFKIDVGSGTVNVNGNDEGLIDLEVTFFEYEPRDAELSISHGKIEYKTKSDKQISISSITGTVPNGVDLVIDTGSGSVILTDYGKSSALMIDTGSGSIKVSNISDVKDVIFDTGSGDIIIENLISSERLHADTGSGDVIADNVQISERAIFDTGSGVVRINRIMAIPGSVTCDTGSGSVYIRDSSIGLLRADTGSGDVIIDNSIIENRDISTGSGEVKDINKGTVSF
ncbi:MAG: DUF4097 family beta strand repeat-containing protein [Candidatus Cloacimonetes bacterium]|nr:DUF4097 family beta strand repeat-containing protein [Candidatus Cloacimonadota bacterium]